MKNRQRTGHTDSRHTSSQHSASHDEWICGLNPVLEAVRSGRRVRKVFIASSRKEKIFELENEIASRGIEIRKADLQFFDDRFHKGHQGIAAVAEPRKYSGLEDILVIPGRKKQLPLFLILDGIEDPRNFGAILRVADAGGVHGIVIQSHRSASLTPEAIKSSAGASEHVPIAMVPNIKHAMKEMTDAGIMVVGAESGTDKSLWDIDMKMPLAVVMGSEGEGLRKTVKEHCDAIVHIPMKGMVNSLNVSVATGIIIFEVMRQRAQGGSASGIG